MIRKYLIVLFGFVCPLYSGTIDVEKYSNNSSLQWVWGVTTLNSLELIGNESILDVGCGDGKISALLATKVPQGYVIGVEPFQQLIDFAQDKYRNENLSFELKSAVSLDFVEQFDVVTSFLTFNWLEEPQLAIQGIARSLKPGGVGILTLPTPAKDNSWRQVWINVLQSDKYKPYVHLFEYQNRSITVENLQSWIAQAGLQLDEITISVTPVVFHDRVEVREWLNALNPRMDQMPPKILDDLADEYIKFISMMSPQAGDNRIYVFPEKMQIRVTKPQFIP